MGHDRIETMNLIDFIKSNTCVFQQHVQNIQEQTENIRAIVNNHFQSIDVMLNRYDIKMKAIFDKYDRQLQRNKV